MSWARQGVPENRERKAGGGTRGLEVWAELGLATLHVYLKVFQSAAYGTCCQWVEVKVEEEDVVKHGKRVREGEGEAEEEGEGAKKRERAAAGQAKRIKIQSSIIKC